LLLRTSLRSTAERHACLLNTFARIDQEWDPAEWQAKKQQQDKGNQSGLIQSNKYSFALGHVLSFWFDSQVEFGATKSSLLRI
jgi:hypothetical protein